MQMHIFIINLYLLLAKVKGTYINEEIAKPAECKRPTFKDVKPIRVDASIFFYLKKNEYTIKLYINL